jgi:hypothetical protein
MLFYPECCHEGFYGGVWHRPFQDPEARVSVVKESLCQSTKLHLSTFTAARHCEVGVKCASKCVEVVIVLVKESSVALFVTSYLYIHVSSNFPTFAAPTMADSLEFLAAVFKGDKPIKPPASSRPYVTLTFAQSLDAKIAGINGKQLILSGKESMVMTHWYMFNMRISHMLLTTPG